MKHINLSSWKGSITDWTELNYIQGGLADEYADVANVKGNYVKKSENLFDIQNAVYSSSDNWNITTNFYLEAGKTYTIKSNSTEHSLFTTGVAGWKNISNVSKTFTPSESGYLMFGAPDYQWYTHLTEFKQLEIMLNEGNTALPYQPGSTTGLYIEDNVNDELIPINE